jgi:hypothetical protein
VLSTHLIDEVANLLEHLLIIDQGRILLDRDADEVRGSATTGAVRPCRVESFVADRAVIGARASAAWRPSRSTAGSTRRDRIRAAELGLELAPVSLQQLIVHMTGADLRTDRPNRRSQHDRRDRTADPSARSRGRDSPRCGASCASRTDAVGVLRHPWIILGAAWLVMIVIGVIAGAAGRGHREDGRGHALQLGGAVAAVVSRRRRRPGHRPHDVVRSGIRRDSTRLLARHER